MNNPGPTKEEYGSLIYKLTTLGAKAATALVVAFLVGCTTFGDIRKSEPVKSVLVIDVSLKN